MTPTIPFRVVCKRCLCRTKAQHGYAGWCDECHAEVLAEIAARWSIPPGMIGPPMYALADCGDWKVIDTLPRRRVRVRLVSGVDLRGLIPLDRVVQL